MFMLVIVNKISDQKVNQLRQIRCRFDRCMEFDENSIN